MSYMVVFVFLFNWMILGKSNEYFAICSTIKLNVNIIF